MRRAGVAFVAAFAIAAIRPALAGPPFVTDDPEPTDTGHFEDYLYTEGTRAGGEFSGPGVGVELNYGVAPDTQLTASIPINPNPGPGGAGLVFNPLAVSVKYRFVEEDDNGWRPQVAFFPAIQIPVGSASHTIPTTEFLPIWAQKTVIGWTAFGGGGWTVNPGAENRGFLLYGAGLMHAVTEKFELGAEFFGETRDAAADRAGRSIGIGALYDFSDEWHLIGSFNTGITARREDEYSYMVALKWTI